MDQFNAVVDRKMRGRLSRLKTPHFNSAHAIPLPSIIQIKRLARRARRSPLAGAAGKSLAASAIPAQCGASSRSQTADGYICYACLKALPTSSVTSSVVEFRCRCALSLTLRFGTAPICQGSNGSRQVLVNPLLNELSFLWVVDGANSGGSLESRSACVRFKRSYSIWNGLKSLTRALFLDP